MAGRSLRCGQLLLDVGRLRGAPSVAPELSVAALVHDHLIRGDERALPVVTDGKLLGLVSFSNVREVAPEQWAPTHVGSIMRRVDSLSVTTPEQPLAKAFEQLAQQNVAQLPVVVDGQLVGMLLRLDIARWLELAWRPGLSGRASVTPRRIAPTDRGSDADVPRHRDAHVHSV